jgi:hypothetical protein
MLEVLKTGKPASWGAKENEMDWEKAMERDNFADMFTAGMDSRGAFFAPGLARSFDFSKYNSIIDIAGASGIYAACIKEKYSKIKAALFEKPPVNDIAKIGLKKRGIENNIKVASLAIDGCVSTKNYFQHYANSETCKNRYSYTLEFVSNNPGKTIIIPQAWPHVKEKTKKRKGYKGGDLAEGEHLFIAELNELVKSISNNSKSVFVIGCNQGSKKIGYRYLAKNELPIYKLTRTNIVNFTQKYRENKWNKILSENARAGGYIFIDPSPALCTDHDCYTIKDKKPIYTDKRHLTKFGASIVGKYIMDTINNYNESHIGMVQ